MPILMSLKSPSGITIRIGKKGIAVDPLSSATLFATFVGLLSDFSAERRNRAAASFDEFTQWLIETNHKEVVDLLVQNHTSTINVKALLNLGHEKLFARLQELDKAMAQIATGFNELKSIALAVYPDSELSDQALSILERFVDSGGSELAVVEYNDQPPSLQVLNGDNGNGSVIPYSDTRFILDDISTLVTMGMISPGPVSNGIPIHRLTRNGIKYVEARRHS